MAETTGAPRTVAGRALLANRDAHDSGCPRWFDVSNPDAECDCGLPAAILEIEREARSDIDVETLEKMRDLVEEWLNAERLLDTMTIDDGPAHQDAWDAVHFTRAQLAAEYARLRASDTGRGT